MILKAVAALFLVVAVSGGILGRGYNSIGDSGWKATSNGQWDISNSGSSRSGAWGGSETFRSGVGSAGVNFRSNSLSGSRCNQASSSSGWYSDSNRFSGNNAW